MRPVDRENMIYTTKLGCPIDMEEKVMFDLLKEYCPKGSKVLDIGCGVNWYLSILENIGVSKYIGIDPDVKSIEYAKIMTKNVNLDAKVSVNSVENINCKADTILMLHSNHHLDNQLSMFEKFECQNIILDSWEFQKDINLNDILNHFRTLNFQCIQKKLYNYKPNGINGYRYILHLEKNS